MTQHPRRTFLTLGVKALGLGLAGGVVGCAPHPLYAPNAFGNAPAGSESVMAQLRQVQVPLLPEREGQILRQALQDRLYGGDTPVLSRYNLSVSISINQVGLGVQGDSTLTYVRFIATAPWSLTSQDDPDHKVLISNVAQASDSLNAFDNQPFGQELETNVINARLANAIADQIVTRLAHYFTASGRKLEEAKPNG